MLRIHSLFCRMVLIMILAKKCLLMFAFVAICLGLGWAQQDDTSHPSDPETSTVAATPTPSDQETSTLVPASPTSEAQQEDLPAAAQSALGPGATEAPLEKRSFLVMNLGFGQSAEWDPAASYATRGTGDVSLQKYWGRSFTSVDYVGGSLYYPSNSLNNQSYIQQVTLAQRFLGKTRELILVDSFGDSNAGGSFGSSLLSDTAGRGLSYFSGGDVYAVGSVISNVAQAGLTQKLSRRSTLLVLGSYGVSFYSGAASINNRDSSVAAQYGYRLDRRSTIGALFVHRSFQFPAGNEGSVGSYVTAFSYSRMLSRRFSFVGSVGPSFDNITSQFVVPIITPPLVLTVKTRRIDLSAYGELGYAFRNGAAGLSYQRLTTGGSGLFAGANTDAVVLTISRRLSRAWGENLSAGFARLKQIQQSSAGTIVPSYQYWYAGATLTRNIGRSFNFFGSYQFTNQNSTNSTCVANHCLGRQSLVTIGLNWHPRAIRLGGGNDFSQRQDNPDHVEGDSTNMNDSNSSAQNNDR